MGGPGDCVTGEGEFLNVMGVLPWFVFFHFFQHVKGHQGRLMPGFEGASKNRKKGFDKGEGKSL